MKVLFDLDVQDYNPEGRVIKRPSVRAIISKNGKMLLVYSKKYNYFKFPGGGIEKAESFNEALIREVREETGYQVIADSIEPYGRVMRRQKDSFEDDCIFEQENLYFFCNVDEEQVSANPDAYEIEEGFTPVWIDPIEASRHNRYEFHEPGADLVMIKRDARVLDMADLEIRRKERKLRELAAIESLGELDYKGMLDYVELCLQDNADINIEQSKTEISYSRFEHTKRVLGWAKRLYDMSECKNILNYEDLMIATIFHDVGRRVAIKTNEPHAKAGIPITREFLLNHGFDAARTEYICGLVGSHSDKHLMKNADIDPNLLMLMEADLLDDMGALGIVMDCMITEARNPEARFTDCLDHIMRFTRRIQRDNPMTTDNAKKLWDDKTRLVNDFTEALIKDIEL